MRQEAAIFPLAPTAAACSASLGSSPDTSGLTLERNHTLAHIVHTEPVERLTWRNTANEDTSTDPHPTPQNCVATGCHTGNHTPNNSNPTRFLQTMYFFSMGIVLDQPVGKTHTQSIQGVPW